MFPKQPFSSSSTSGRKLNSPFTKSFDLVRTHGGSRIKQEPNRGKGREEEGGGELEINTAETRKKRGKGGMNEDKGKERKENTTTTIKKGKVETCVNR